MKLKGLIVVIMAYSCYLINLPHFDIGLSLERQALGYPLTLQVIFKAESWEYSQYADGGN